MALAEQSIVERVKASLLEHADEDGGLITEQALCSRLKVGRNTIREALSCLKEQGLIERRQKKGTTLRRPNLKELVDLWDTRCALEGMAARLACPMMSEADLGHLKGRVRLRTAAHMEGGY